MEIKDYIHVKENGISYDLCDDILKEYVPTYEWKSGTVGDYNVEAVSYTHLTLPTITEV